MLSNRQQTRYDTGLSKTQEAVRLAYSFIHNKGHRKVKLRQISYLKKSSCTSKTRASNQKYAG